MKRRKEHAMPKYTVGPHGEIYNNQPVLSERTKGIMEMIIMQDTLNEQMKNLDDQLEETEEDEGTGTPEEGNESICD